MVRIYGVVTSNLNLHQFVTHGKERAQHLRYFRGSIPQSSNWKGAGINFIAEKCLIVPDMALLSPDDRKARLLIKQFPAGQDLDKSIAGLHWKASPATRMMELLRHAGVRLGLVTNGERWMLVDAPPNETTGFASWYAALWLEEPITLRAFCSLLGVRRFFGVSDDETLEAMLTKSASNQQEVWEFDISRVGVRTAHAESFRDVLTQRNVYGKMDR